MEERQKARMLSLARKVLENELQDARHDLEEFNTEELQEKRGLFVTLHLEGNLRGCIGRLEAQTSVFTNIVELSKAAAFEDHRFKNLSREELPEIKIEISLLTIPKSVEGVSSYDKMLKIKPKKDGVILSKGYQNATFLPQVWEQLPLREDFIDALCKKAGFPENYWQENDLNFSVYRVEHFEEP